MLLKDEERRDLFTVGVEFARARAKADLTDGVRLQLALEPEKKEECFDRDEARQVLRVDWNQHGGLTGLCADRRRRRGWIRGLSLVLLMQ